MSKETPGESGVSSSQSSGKNIIIIKKIKKVHGGHHGGAWKVAYADFVTAMMAFFLLMWLISSVSQEKLKGIAEYFTPESGIRDMRSYSGESSTAASKSQRVNISSSGNSKGTTGDTKKKDNETLVVDSDATKLVTVMNDLSKSMSGEAESTSLSENVIIDRVPEGVRIQLIDSHNRSVFKPGSSEIQPFMSKFLFMVTDLIKSVPNYISISGHTSQTNDTTLHGPDEWTLSIERADAIRKFFAQRIKQDQVLRLIGRASTDPFDANDPNSPKNSRVVIILLNSDSLGRNQNAIPTSE
ncbi:MAG: flagellar motor protein MotB [Rickettsiaceae bacterium]|nr:flagellar motor protein MotB [Rickettsiaceae bacterium]